MSGGVDSFMAAWYLLQQGYEVVGMTLNTVAPLSSVESKLFIKEAKDLALKLGIEHHVINVYSAFKKEVIDYFVDEYMRGRTPNPCVRCNEVIKWKLFMEEAKRLGCEKIASGHYVRVIEKEGFYYIQKGKDPAKDQSYFLWNLPQQTLSKCIFPLGLMLKKEVKENAFELGFNNVANKKESMGVCFLQGNDYRHFIDKIKPELKQKLQKGEVLNNEGDSIGSHEGFPYYTIGQKRGLNLYKNHGECVARIDPEHNRLITAPKNTLFSSRLTIKNFIINNPAFLISPQKVDIRIRGLDCVPPTPGTIEHKNKELQIEFDEPVWALTPGQSIVFYKDDTMIGGGVVESLP